MPTIDMRMYKMLGNKDLLDKEIEKIIKSKASEITSKENNDIKDIVLAIYQKLVEDSKKVGIIPRCFLTGERCSKDIQIEENTIFIALSHSAKAENAYKFGIIPVINELGLKPLRAQDKKLNQDFLCKICELIQKSNYVLVDLSEEKGNVTYEAGLAHGLGKETFIIKSKESSEISDLKRSEMIIYDDLERLKDDFLKMFRDTTGKSPTV